MPLKPVVKLFILAETLDIITTLIGLKLGLVETNPLYKNPILLFSLKIALVGVVAIVLQQVTFYRIYFIVPFMAGLVVPWNILNIVLVLI